MVSSGVTDGQLVVAGHKIQRTLKMERSEIIVTTVYIVVSLRQL